MDLNRALINGNSVKTEEVENDEDEVDEFHSRQMQSLANAMEHTKTLFAASLFGTGWKIFKYLNFWLLKIKFEN